MLHLIEEAIDLGTACDQIKSAPSKISPGPRHTHICLAFIFWRFLYFAFQLKINCADPVPASWKCDGEPDDKLTHHIIPSLAPHTRYISQENWVDTFALRMWPVRAFSLVQYQHVRRSCRWTDFFWTVIDSQVGSLRGFTFGWPLGQQFENHVAAAIVAEPVAFRSDNSRTWANLL